MIYEEMSDFKINKAVSKAIGISTVSYPHAADKRSVGVRHSDTNYEWFDYCNNPSDAWQIIDSIFWQLTSADELGVTEWARLIRKEDCSDKLRAAMIVFLMIRDVECQKS